MLRVEAPAMEQRLDVRDGAGVGEVGFGDLPLLAK
jgi:hypothetical protein